jgi:hypothetical protein
MMIGIAGCGGSGSPKSVDVTTPKTAEKRSGTIGRAQLMADVSKTVNAGTARLAVNINMTGLGAEAPDGFGFSASGVTAFKGGDSQLTMDMSSLAQIANRAGAHIDPVDLQAEVRVVDRVMYMHMPKAFGAVFGDPGGWLSIDMRVAKGGAPGSLGSLGGQVDPAQYLSYLSAVSDRVEVVGDDEVRGVACTHYSATIDLEKALARSAPEVQRLFDQLGVSGDVGARLRDLVGNGTIPAEVWIDHDGHLRKMTMTFAIGRMLENLGAASSASSASMTMSMQMYDFGVPVNVQAPPADQVTPFPSLGALRPPTGAAS